MHILHINDSLERGGAETLLVNTVQALAQLHPEVKQTVVTLYDKGELKEGILKDADYYSLNFKRSNPIPAILKLRRIVQKHKVDVVHSHLLHSTFLARIALPKSVGLVSTYHSVFYEPSMVTYARKEKFIDKLTYKGRFFTVFVSDAVKQNIMQAVGITRNYQVLINFAATHFKPEYQFKPESGLKIVMVGNLHEIKNHVIAIQAMGQLNQFPIQLDIYGEGVLRSTLQNLIRETKAKVTLKGAQAMTSKLLSQYDLFMMTSLHEGMPISLLEALQTGLPSLLNDVSMLRETAGEGAVYYKYNDLQDLTCQIDSIYKRKNILATLSQKALLQSEKFSAGSFVEKLMNVYKSRLKA